MFQRESAPTPDLFGTQGSRGERKAPTQPGEGHPGCLLGEQGCTAWEAGLWVSLQNSGRHLQAPERGGPPKYPPTCPPESTQAPNGRLHLDQVSPPAWGGGVPGTREREVQAEVRGEAEAGERGVRCRCRVCESIHEGRGPGGAGEVRGVQRHTGKHVQGKEGNARRRQAQARGMSEWNGWQEWVKCRRNASGTHGTNGINDAESNGNAAQVNSRNDQAPPQPPTQYSRYQQVGIIRSAWRVEQATAQKMTPGEV